MLSIAEEATVMVNYHSPSLSYVQYGFRARTHVRSPALTLFIGQWIP